MRMREDLGSTRYYAEDRLLPAESRFTIRSSSDLIWRMDKENTKALGGMRSTDDDRGGTLTLAYASPATFDADAAPRVPAFFLTLGFS